LATALTLFVLASCDKGTTTAASKREPELTFKAMRFAQYENGKLIFSATARGAQGDLRGGLELDRVTVTHRGFEQSGTVVITAKTGVVGTEGGDPSAIAFSGGVVIKDEHGRVVTTESARGTFADKRVSAPGHVTLASPELNAQAESVEGSLDSMEFVLHGPVTGTFDAAGAR
jgi:LPS export ABC transporter protein LptC